MLCPPPLPIPMESEEEWSRLHRPLTTVSWRTPPDGVIGIVVPLQERRSCCFMFPRSGKQPPSSVPSDRVEGGVATSPRSPAEASVGRLPPRLGELPTAPQVNLGARGGISAPLSEDHHFVVAATDPTKIPSPVRPMHPLLASSGDRRRVKKASKSSDCGVLTEACGERSCGCPTDDVTTAIQEK